MDTEQARKRANQRTRKFLKFKGNHNWVTEGNISIEIGGESPIEEISLDKLNDKDFKNVKDTKRLDKVLSKL